MFGEYQSQCILQIPAACGGHTNPSMRKQACFASFEQLGGYAQTKSKRKKPRQCATWNSNGRGDMIRTCDILLPKQALYQTELRPEVLKL